MKHHGLRKCISQDTQDLSTNHWVPRFRLTETPQVVAEKHDGTRSDALEEQDQLYELCRVSSLAKVADKGWHARHTDRH